MGAFVYILQCADDSYYVGSARGDDLDKRFYEHQTGALGGYTSTRRPVRLVFHEHFERINDAIAAERRIKGWSRAKKEALIPGEWDRLPWLAKRPGGRTRILSKTTDPERATQNAPAQGACFEARPDGLAPQHEDLGAGPKLPSPHAEVRAQRASKHAVRQGGTG
ncbi:MAG: GIY-YIG nuclease family protein [Microvirga sp.]